MQKSRFEWTWVHLTQVHGKPRIICVYIKGQFVVSRSGTIGNLAYVRDDMDGLIGSDDIIRIVADPIKSYQVIYMQYFVAHLYYSLIKTKKHMAL